MTENMNTPEFWDTQFSAEYEAWQKGDWKNVRWLPMKFSTVTSLGVPNSGRILDIGCGLGHFLRYLGSRHPGQNLLYGTDFSSFAVRASQKANWSHNYSVADAYTQPYSDGFFDAVVAMDIIEHLSDVPAFIKELGRLTKPGGSIFITTPRRRESGEKHSEEHVTEFTENGLVSVMRKICKDHTFAKPFLLTDQDTGQQFLDPTMYYKGTRKELS